MFTLLIVISSIDLRSMAWSSYNSPQFKIHEWHTTFLIQWQVCHSLHCCRGIPGQSKWLMTVDSLCYVNYQICFSTVITTAIKLEFLQIHKLDQSKSSLAFCMIQYCCSNIIYQTVTMISLFDAFNLGLFMGNTSHIKLTTIWAIALDVRCIHWKLWLTAITYTST